jgi:hypothetical protein
VRSTSITGPKGRLAAAIAAVSLLATQAPKELFTRCGWDYATYRIAGFVVLVLALTVVGVFWLRVRSRYRRDAAAVKLCGGVLTFCWVLDIRAGEDVSEPQ